MLHPAFENFHPLPHGTPRHVGIIPDGGRRWSRLHGLSLLDSYRVSIQKLAEISAYLFARGVTTVSIYCSSTQNFRRSPEEVDAFCRAAGEFCSRHAPPVVAAHGTRVAGVGRREVLPDHLRADLERIEHQTRENTATRVNLCVAYNPLYEAFEAARQASTPQEFLERLWIGTPADVIIRTGGSNLLSNFLLMQAGFSRVYFLDMLLNDLRLEDVGATLDAYERIEHNYGV